jgi:hypothetical protein
MVTNSSDSNLQNNSAQHTTSGNANSVLFGQAPPDWMEYFPALQYEQADEPAALHLSLAFGKEILLRNEHKHCLSRRTSHRQLQNGSSTNPRVMQVFKGFLYRGINNQMQNIVQRSMQDSLMSLHGVPRRAQKNIEFQRAISDSIKCCQHQ